MTDKKITFKRIFIFLFFAFVPTWILDFIYIAAFGCNTETAYYNLTGALSMLFPMLGNFMSRIITKEGAKNNLLKVNLKGNLKYYMTAIFLPVLYAFISAFCVTLFFMPSGTTSEIIHNMKFGTTITTIIYLVTVSSLNCVLGFGEECGWRGYLTPKLEELMSTPLSIVLSGIIWGLWHAPAIVIGHNFGTDYRFYPYAGIVAMCVFCTFIGTYFTVLTKKTNSVFPAALAHAGNNNIVTAVFSMVILETVNINVETIEKLNENLSFVMLTVTCLVTSIVSILITFFSKNNKKVS